MCIYKRILNVFESLTWSFVPYNSVHFGLMSVLKNFFCFAVSIYLLFYIGKLLSSVDDFFIFVHFRQLEEDRIAKIEYENRRLLANIARIESKPNKDYWNENYM